MKRYRISCIDHIGIKWEADNAGLPLDLLPILEGEAHILLAIDCDMVCQGVPELLGEFTYQTLLLLQGLEEQVCPGLAIALVLNSLFQGFYLCMYLTISF